MKTHGILFLAFLLAGCMNLGNTDEASTGDPATCSDPDTSLPLNITEDTWMLCVEPGFEASVQQLQMNISLLESNVNHTSASLPSLETTELIASWKAYEQQLKADQGNLNQSLTALANLEPNATVHNASWTDVKTVITSLAHHPREIAQQELEARLGSQAREVQSDRLQISLVALGILFGGVVVGGVAVIPSMGQVRKRAQYWGAFSKSKDVEKRQGLHGWISLGLAILGLAGLVTALLIRGLA